LVQEWFLKKRERKRSTSARVIQRKGRDGRGGTGPKEENRRACMKKGLARREGTLIFLEARKKRSKRIYHNQLMHV
jgi:hypothetical protein